TPVHVSCSMRGKTSYSAKSMKTLMSTALICSPSSLPTAPSETVFPCSQPAETGVLRSTSDKNVFGKRELQLVPHHNESADRRKTGMTEIYIELGGKKAIVWSLEWLGWCRIRTSEAAAVQALIETEVRYQLIAQRA